MFAKVNLQNFSKRRIFKVEGLVKKVVLFVSVKLNLEGYSIHNLNYLKCGDIHQDEIDDSNRFQAWKVCLGL